MPRQMPMTLRPRICAQARGVSILLAFQIGCRGSRRQRPLQDRPPTLQAFRSVLSRTRSVSTHGLHGSRSYLRRHGVQFRGVHIYYHKTAFTVHPKNRWPGGRLNTKAQTPPLLGTDPAKPLILMAQTALSPESHPRYLAFACPEETLRRARPHAPPRALPRHFALFHACSENGRSRRDFSWTHDLPFLYFTVPFSFFQKHILAIEVAVGLSSRRGAEARS